MMAVRIAHAYQQIDTRHCPPDFRRAYQEHINAWRAAESALAMDNNFMAFIEGFGAGYFNDPSMLGASARDADAAILRINQTLDHLVVVASHYGARMPASY